MAKTKKSQKNHKNSQTRFAEKIIDALPLLIVGAILVTVLVSIGLSYYDKHQQQKATDAAEQKLLTEGLSEAGTLFDGLKNSLQSKGIAGEVTRDTYCYHASRKFEVGPLYCAQRLDIVAESSTDEQTLRDFALIYSQIKEYPLFSFVSDETIRSFDQSGRIFYYQGDKKIIGCSVDFTGYGGSFGNENSQNTYDISIRCLGGDFVEPIYPLND